MAPRGRPKGKKKMGRRPNQKKYNERKYGIVKQMNYNGFHCFKEKSLETISLFMDAGGTAAYTSSGGSSWGGPVKQFKLDDLSDLSNYQALWDEYRITAVKLKIYPAWDSTSSAINTNTPGGTLASTSIYQPGSTPVLWWNYDGNDASNPASIGELFERDPKTVKFDKPIQIFCKNPYALTLSSNDPSSTVDVTNMVRRPVRSPWINMTQGSVGHLGVQWGVFNAPPNSSLRLSTVVTYYFQCKGNQ